MAKQKIKVKSGLGRKPDGGFPLAIFERNDDHEDGEIFIADNKVHDVTMTAQVRAALNRGDLIEAGDDEEAGDEFEPDLSPDRTVELRSDDDAADLEERYTKAELVSLAEAHGIELKSNWTKSEIADAIISGAPDEDED